MAAAGEQRQHTLNELGKKIWLLMEWQTETRRYETATWLEAI